MGPSRIKSKSSSGDGCVWLTGRSLRFSLGRAPGSPHPIPTPFNAVAYLAVAVANLILIISSSYSALCISMVSDDMSNDLWQYVGIVHDKLRREEFALMQALASERRAHGHYVHAGCQPCLHPGG